MLKKITYTIINRTKSILVLVKKALIWIYRLSPKNFDMLFGIILGCAIFAFLFYLVARTGHLKIIMFKEAETMSLEEMREAWLKHKDKYK